MEINHPVHIISENKQLSPSAFIPFCEFGGNTSAMGEKIDQFDVPVCNSFQATILNGQLCYEVDLHIFSNKDNIINEIKSGFVFIMDYNEDRQVLFNKDYIQGNITSFTDKIIKSNDNQHASIYLNTIGKARALDFVPRQGLCFIIQ